MLTQTRRHGKSAQEAFLTPFADDSMSRDYGGIGLGVALVRRLTALLHGDLNATDEGSATTRPLRWLWRSTPELSANAR